MIRKITLSLLACLGISFASVAQSQPHPVCGSAEMHNSLMQTDPAFANIINDMNTRATALMNNPSALVTTNSNGQKVWEIPVVVHVMVPTGVPGSNLGGTYNPSDVAIQNMINYLSQAFQATYTGHPNAGPLASDGKRMPIIFKLAQRTPNCASTNGIVRVDMSSYSSYMSGGIFRSSTGMNEIALKAVSLWPNTEYYNIWLCWRIDGINQANATGPYVAGYAWFNGAPADRDGTVILTDKANVGNTTLTHELGHAFNLYHVFEDDGGGSVCPPNANPLVDGDRCADTKPMMRSVFNCPANNANVCDVTGYNFTQHNFMDYSSCDELFTPDQTLRVFAAMMSKGTSRGSLISSLAATPLGVNAVNACAFNAGAPVAGNNFGPRGVHVLNSANPDTLIMSVTSGGYNVDGAVYVDNTCKHRAMLKAGTTYRMSVDVGPNSEVTSVWIDYNNNGAFAATEQVYSATGAGARGYQTFQVPLTATSCQVLRMRVVSGSIASGACGAGGFDRGQCEDYEVLIEGGAGSGGTVLPTPGLADVNPPTLGNPSCFGTGNTVTVTPSSSINPLWYQWFRKSTTNVVTPGPSGATATSWNDNTWGNLDSVWVRIAVPGVCGADTVLSDTMVMYRPLTIPPAVTIGVTAGAIPGCAGDPLMMGVTGNVNPGGGPLYQWRVNNLNVGANSAVSTFDATSLVPGDKVTVIMTSSATAPCAIPSTATSNEITILPYTTRVPTFQIALTQGTNPGCANQVLTFTAINITTGGTSPTFVWKKNGIAQPGFTGTTYSGVFNNGDVISAEMTSSSACAVPATVNNSGTSPVIVHQLLTADITITQLSGGNPACSGKPSLYQAFTTNAGINPQFQWMINNIPVPNANGQLFQTTALLNNDAVSCILIATDPCVANTLDTSNQIFMLVKISKTPTVSFTITDGNNPGCLDSLLEFTATANNAGVNPNFDWFVNGFGPILNGNVYSTTNLLNGDVVTVRVNQTDGECYLPDTVFSAPLIAVRSVTPEPPIISLIGNMLITNKSGAFVWFGPNGQIEGGEDGYYHPGELGKYYAVTNNNGCWSKPSNVLTITLLNVNDVAMEAPRLYPNPTTGLLTADWGHNVNMSIAVHNTLGQKLIESKVQNEAKTTLDLNGLANGVYFIITTDDKGGSITTRVTLNK